MSAQGSDDSSSELVSGQRLCVRSLGAADRLDRADGSVERVHQAVDYVKIGSWFVRLIMADRVERMRIRREQGRDLWTGEKRNT